jgi:hypothetical protein
LPRKLQGRLKNPDIGRSLNPLCGEIGLAAAGAMAGHVGRRHKARYERGTRKVHLRSAAGAGPEWAFLVRNSAGRWMALTAWRRSSAREARDDNLPYGLDLDRAVATGGLDRFPGRPAGSRFNTPADRQGGGHDRGALIKSRLRSQTGALHASLGRAEAVLDVPEIVAAADDEAAVRAESRRPLRYYHERGATAARPCPSVEKPTVRTDRPRAQIPSAIYPWTPRHSGRQRYKVTHHGTEKNGPHSREYAANGPFSQVVAGVVVAGVGFEPT